MIEQRVGRLSDGDIMVEIGTRTLARVRQGRNKYKGEFPMGMSYVTTDSSLSILYTVEGAFSFSSITTRVAHSLPLHLLIHLPRCTVPFVPSDTEKETVDREGEGGATTLYKRARDTVPITTMYLCTNKERQCTNNDRVLIHCTSNDRGFL